MKKRISIVLFSLLATFGIAQTNDSLNLSQREDSTQYPNRETEWMPIIARYLWYPPIEREKGIQGTVYIMFTVTSTGELTNFSVEKGVSKALDQVALETAMKIPHLTPCILNGSPIACIEVIPVKFKLL